MRRGGQSHGGDAFFPARPPRVPQFSARGAPAPARCSREIVLTLSIRLSLARPLQYYVAYARYTSSRNDSYIAAKIVRSDREANPVNQW
ncbi:unnamed protein product [Pieris brassicae]|uniref:Uncharacterized protein n=1 Tax=Pieris brassicae TaxID=7116 RepID=A0A9P0TE21_PIEBR|nr:unnamed protein product [Pieris brassicae]